MTFIIEALGLTAGGGKAGLMRLVPALAEHTEHRFVVVLADLPEFAKLARPNVKLVMRRKPRSLLAREVHLQRTVPRLCIAERANALLCLGNFAPRRSAVPAVVLLHNANYVGRDDAAGTRLTLRERAVAWYGRRMLRRLPSGVRLIVQTELMKRRIAEAYPRAGASTMVIPDSDGLPQELVVGEFDVGAAATSKSREPFTFLCVAHYYPHKNLEALVDALRLLRPRASQAARCLLTIDASQHPGARRLLERIEAEGLRDALVNIGALSGGKLAEAYRSADAFILPTLLESFGRTYREALRFGLPILTSDRDFARHACGDAAIYFDPQRPESIAGTMAQIIDDAALRGRLSHAGLRMAAQSPSWEEIAAQFVGVLEDAARGAGVRDGRPEVGLRKSTWVDLCKSGGKP